MIKWLGNHGSVGAARRAARQNREQDGKAAGKSGGLLVHCESFIFSDARCCASAFEHETRRPGWAPLREAPTTLGSEMQQKIRETGLSKNPFL